MKKTVVVGMVFMFVTLGWGSISLGEQPPVSQGELRVVDMRFTTFGQVTYNIFEHLIEIDKNGKLTPGLATEWSWHDDRTLEMKLRQGVIFHNGETFDAEIVKLNWDESFRSRPTHILGKFLEFKPGSRLQIVDPYTVQFIFPEADGAALAKLAAMHLANRQFYMELGWGDATW